MITEVLDSGLNQARQLPLAFNRLALKCHSSYGAIKLPHRDLVPSHGVEEFGEQGHVRAGSVGEMRQDRRGKLALLAWIPDFARDGIHEKDVCVGLIRHRRSIVQVSGNQRQLYARVAYEAHVQRVSSVGLRIGEGN